MSILKPARLKKHDVIGIVAPASAPTTTEKIDKGICYLERLGYRVKIGKHAKAVHGYLAGQDKGRLADLHAMFADKQVKAIISVRGGYGTPRLLHRIDYDLIRRNPKILVGYSDLTSLQLAIFEKTRLITFSGPMLAVDMFEKIDPFTEEFFWRLVTSSEPLGKVLNPSGEPLQVFRSPRQKHRALGRLLGGNLSMIVSLMGTPFQPKFSNRILFFEEVGEEPYRVDRMLTQLKHAGIFTKVCALVLGLFADCVPADKTKPSLTVDEVLWELLADIKVPILANLHYGHIPRKLTMPIGLRASVDSRSGSFEFLEGAVE